MKRRSGKSAPRATSKLASVIAMLGRLGGASLLALTQATGWLPHTARAALTGLPSAAMRSPVRRDRNKDGDRISEAHGGRSLGARIETHRLAFSTSPSQVAPCAGARIETIAAWTFSPFCRSQHHAEEQISLKCECKFACCRKPRDQVNIENHLLWVCNGAARAIY